MLKYKRKCTSDSRWYSYNPYETRCTVCGQYFPEDNPPDCRDFNETDYKIKDAEQRLLDTANPAFQPVDYSKKGKNMQADFKIGEDETAEEYWRRVRTELAKT